MKIFRRLIFVLRAALVYGLAHFTQALVSLVNSEIWRFSPGPESLPVGNRHDGLFSQFDEPKALPRYSIEQMLDVEMPATATLNGNPDKEDTAIFRLPPESIREEMVLKFTDEERALLRQVRKKIGFETDEQTVLSALSLFSKVVPKLKKGYLLRLDRVGQGPKISFVFE